MDFVSLILLGKACVRFQAIVGALADNKLARPIDGGPGAGVELNAFRQFPYAAAICQNRARFGFATTCGKAKVSLCTN